MHFPLNKITSVNLTILLKHLPTLTAPPHSYITPFLLQRPLSLPTHTHSHITISLLQHPLTLTTPPHSYNTHHSYNTKSLL